MYSLDSLPKIRAMDAWIKYGYDFSIWDKETPELKTYSSKTFPELKISAKKFAEKNNIPQDEFMQIRKQARKIAKKMKSIR